MDPADNRTIQKFFAKSKFDVLASVRQAVRLMPSITSFHSVADAEIDVTWSYGSLGSISLLHVSGTHVSGTPFIAYCRAVDMVMVHLPLRGETIAWYRYWRDVARAGRPLCILRYAGCRREFSDQFPV
jgi:hypothetical protein